MPSPGLTTTQVTKLIQEHGLNQLTQSSRTEPLKIFLNQFKGPLSIILLSCAAVAFFISDIFDSLLIVSIVIINSSVSFFQEFRATKSIEALKKLFVSEVSVLRDGKRQTINTTYLVPGDTIFLEEGNKVPADGIILEAFGLEVDESSLTGESLPVIKEVEDGENGEVFSGTVITSGHAKVKVTSTGMKTRFGQIASLLNDTKEEKTPLEKQLLSLGKTLAVVVVLLIVVIFFYGYLNGREFFSTLFTSMSLAVSVIPEGLPVILTATLAIGVQRMSKRKAIIRRLDSIETLGATNVICTDKTGTLTKNEMRVDKAFVGGQLLELKDLRKSKLLEKLLQIGSVANNATFVTEAGSQKMTLTGDKTETSLIEFSHSLGFPVESFRNPNKKVAEFAFDSDLKLMSVVTTDSQTHQLLTKGAAEIVLARSKYVLSENGKVKKLTNTDLTKTKMAMDKLAETGQRLIGLAYKNLKSSNPKRDEAEKDLVFVGFVGISDPLREEVPSAVKQANEAGIRTIMITGDNPLTAAAIASKAGIFTQNQLVLTGSDLEKMADFELSEKLMYVNVFARTTPADKGRIVKLLQSSGLVVAVTGDGVNDAPALKIANVGVSMAITGTDVAKETADIILTDDNYSTLVSAVEEGRVVYDNVIKALKFLLATNSSELFLVMSTIFLGLPTALTPIQILWINLATDSLPALALATDPKDPLVMKKLPREKSKSILTIINPLTLLKSGLVIALIVGIVFAILLEISNVQTARITSFTLLVLLQLVMAFKFREGQKLWSNQKLILATLVIIVTQVVIVINPTLSNFFNRS